MFSYIKRFLTDADFFTSVMGRLGALMPSTPALIRFAISATGILVNRGVLPGGGTDTGWYASMIATVAPFLISSGDKNLSLDEITEHITKNVGTTGAGGLTKKP